MKVLVKLSVAATIAYEFGVGLRFLNLAAEVESRFSEITILSIVVSNQ